MFWLIFSTSIFLITCLILLFKINKLKKFLFYVKTINKNRKGLKALNINVDWIYRLYTVINFEPDIQDDIKVYGYDLLDNEVRKRIRSIQNYLKEIGLFEYVGTSSIDRISEFSILLVIESAHINSKKLTLWILVAIIFMYLGLLMFFL